MSFPRTAPILLLLILHLVLLCSPSAYGNPAQHQPFIRTPKHRASGGCLNYGHSCLGAHGKRASWPAVVRPPAPHRPLLLDLILDDLAAPITTPTLKSGRLLSRPFYRSLSTRTAKLTDPRRPTSPQIKDEGRLEKKDVMDDMHDRMARRMDGRDGPSDGDSDSISSNNDRRIYLLNLDDDYTENRKARNVGPSYDYAEKSDTDNWNLPNEEEEEEERKERNTNNLENMQLRMLENWFRR